MANAESDDRYNTIEMMRLAAFFLALVSFQDVTSTDDVGVYRAVINHTLVSEFRRYSNGTGASADVRMSNRTIAACGSVVDRELGCVGGRQMGEFFTPRSADRLAELSLEERTELIASFNRRNGSSVTVPGNISSSATLLSSADLADLTKEIIAGRRGNFAAFSLPAYSANRHALVYVTYACGNLCGYGWVFLLKNTGTDWTVVSRRELWIS